MCSLKYFVGSIVQHIMVSNFRNRRKVFENVFHSMEFPYEKGLLRFHWKYRTRHMIIEDCFDGLEYSGIWVNWVSNTVLFGKIKTSTLIDFISHFIGFSASFNQGESFYTFGKNGNVLVEGTIPIDQTTSPTLWAAKHV